MAQQKCSGCHVLSKAVTHFYKHNTSTTLKTGLNITACRKISTTHLYSPPRCPTNDTRLLLVNCRVYSHPGWVHYNGHIWERRVSGSQSHRKVVHLSRRSSVYPTHPYTDGMWSAPDAKSSPMLWWPEHKWFNFNIVYNRHLLSSVSRRGITANWTWSYIPQNLKIQFEK